MHLNVQVAPHSKRTPYRSQQEYKCRSPCAST